MSYLIAFAWSVLARLLERRQQPRFAAHCYGMAVGAQPSPRAKLYLRWGQALQASQQFSEAVEPFEQAIALEPEKLQARLCLGKVLLQLGNFVAAKIVFDEALKLDSSAIEAHNGLGLCYLNTGKPADALAQFEQILAISPDHVKALNNKVAALLGLGRYEAAEQVALTALSGPCKDHAGLHYNLGHVYGGMEKISKSIHHFRESLRLDPDFQEAKYILGSMLGDPALYGDAIPYLEKKIAQEGRSLGLLETLAAACLGAGQLTKCAEACKQVLEMNPESAHGWLVQASLECLLCKQEDAISSLERSMAADPRLLGLFSTYLFILQTVPGTPARFLFQRHLDWAERFAKAETSFEHQPPGPGLRGKRLRIGYVTPDVVAHPVGYLLHAALFDRDPSQHEVYIYAHNPFSDGLTEKLRKLADSWCDTNGLSNVELAERINTDGIDILVELSGHTDKHRLPLMAHRAAPIQVSWIGYFHSTGLSVTDYFISDPFSTPSEGEQLFSETLLHLPHTRFCFRPYDFMPEISPLACERNGHITFGCFNRLDKINSLVLETWARILHGMPGSRLLLKSSGFQDDLVRNEIFDRFAVLGIPEERLELREREVHPVMLQQIRDFDIALDPFPFSGGMTTLECLYMGIPLVTLAGKGLVERQSVSALNNIGMPELVFDSLDSYVNGAIALAQDRARLKSLHERLRPAVQASPLCDTAAFARDLDALYRRMWEVWCEGGKLPSDLASQRMKG